MKKEKTNIPHDYVGRLDEYTMLQFTCEVLNVGNRSIILSI
jgi:hypothetical protein